MDIYLSQNFRNYLFLSLALVLFLSCAWWGKGKGKKQAESALVLSQAQEMTKALDYFYSDNSRFPTADEFARPEVLQSYLSRVPQNNDISDSACPQTFSYSRPSPSAYELDFCLPIALNGYKRGLNSASKNF